MSLAISGTLATSQPAEAGAHLPRFAYRNHFIEGDVTVSSEQAQFPYELALDGFTDTVWIGEEGVSTWWMRVDQPGAAADFCGLLLFGDNPLNAPVGTTVRLQASDDDGAEWQDVAGPVGATDRVVGFVFDAEQHDAWRILFEGDTPPRVADVTLCKALVGDTGIASPFEPPTLARNNEIMNNQTEVGHFVGRSRIRRGISTQFQLKRVHPEWVRDQWEPLLDHAERRPLYMIWDPIRWPNEIAYVWTSESPPAPTYSSNAGWMDVRMSVEGFGG